MTLILYVFSKLKTVKNVLDKYLTRPVLEHPWKVNMAGRKGRSQTLVKSAWQHFYHIFHRCRRIFELENVSRCNM